VPATYPTADPAPWPLRLPAGAAPEDVARLEAEARSLADRAQYGWGHTIDFGPFRVEGLLGEKYLRLAGVLDSWGWWPADLSGLTVADVGCYTGGLSLLLAARGAEQVVAVDEVGDHLEQVAFLAGALDTPNVRPVETSLYRLHDHVEPESLDLVLLAGVLYHLSDMLVGLVALQQLLRPGGVLIVESNAVECYDHSYANFGRYFGGMWWQPTALCIADLAEHAGLADADVRFYQPGRALARATKPPGARVPFKRGMHWAFADLRDETERGLDPSVMAPAPCRHADAGMVGRWWLRATHGLLRLPMRLGYRWRHRRRRG
jgi:SAM-dependent methyltransferase